MNNIQTVIDRILSSEGKELENAMYELYDIVKKHEGEDILQPIEDALPQLAHLLSHDDHRYNVDGCSLSIFRKVRINEATIDRLIALNQSNRNGAYVHALGHVQAELWTQAIEIEITKGLDFDDAAYSAATMLYRKSNCILMPETVVALAKSATNAEFLTASIAANALCCLMNGGHHKLAIEKLRPLLHHNDQRIRLGITEALGWATAKGFELLRITATDADAEVRAATVAAIERTYLNEPDAQAVITFAQ